MKNAGRKTICGTWRYAAPEVRRTRGIYGTNSDMYSVGIILYEMLCMVHPFDPGSPEYPASDSLMYDRSCRDEFGFYEPEWDNVSRLCLDFICKLIVSDPEKRLSSQQALEHPWLRCIPPVQRPKPTINHINRRFCKTFSCLEPLRHQVLSVQGISQILGRYKTMRTADAGTRVQGGVRVREMSAPTLLLTTSQSSCTKILV